MAAVFIGVVFLGVAVFLYRGLFLDPSELPSALIGKPLPAFSLPAVQDGKPLTEADLKGKPALVNVWATFCRPCILDSRQHVTMPAG